uniref:CSON011385 protein n=1 Tax=Culicoides sonorensis TaxID=179676 RepID=A0A336M5Z8_CULSO
MYQMRFLSMQSQISKQSMQMSVQSQVSVKKLSMQSVTKLNSISNKKTVSDFSMSKIYQLNIKKKIIIISPMIDVNILKSFDRFNCSDFICGDFCNYRLRRYHHHRKGGHLHRGVVGGNLGNMGMLRGTGPRLTGELNNSHTKWRHSKQQISAQFPESENVETTKSYNIEELSNQVLNQLLNELDHNSQEASTTIVLSTSQNIREVFGGSMGNQQQLPIQSQDMVKQKTQQHKTLFDLGEQLNTPIIENKFDEFDFSNRSTNKTDSILNSNSINITNSNQINNNNYVKLSELQLLSPASPQDFWGPPSLETTTYDEQYILSPQSDVTVKTILTDSSNCFESDNEKMCFNDILNDNDDKIPLDFEDDFIKYSKVADYKQKEIKECYEQHKPMPTILESEEELNYFKKMTSDENSQDMVDDAVFTKVELSSQDPANMVIYPTTITDSQEALGDPEIVTTEHSYVGNESSNVKVAERQNNIKEEKIPRVPALRLKIPKVPSNIFEDNVVDTPEVIDVALDLMDNFNLIDYINKPETTFEVVKEEPKDIPSVSQKAEEQQTTIVTSSIRPKRKSSVTIETLTELIQTPKRRYSSRTRASTPSTISEYLNPSSVQSTASSDDSYRTPKRRGRPAKPVASLLDLNEFAHLSPEDLRYRELRNKNNEASRRSRMQKRSREQMLEDEAQKLESDYKFLEMEQPESSVFVTELRASHERCNT